MRLRYSESNPCVASWLGAEETRRMAPVECHASQLYAQWCCDFVQRRMRLVRRNERAHLNSGNDVGPGNG